MHTAKNTEKKAIKYKEQIHKTSCTLWAANNHIGMMSNLTFCPRFPEVDKAKTHGHCWMENPLEALHHAKQWRIL
jgi:hypothetical protein